MRRALNGYDDLKILLSDSPQVVSWLLTADSRRETTLENDPLRAFGIADL